MADGDRILQSADDYTAVAPGDIPITGDIYPYRLLRSTAAARCLKREDMAALAEIASWQNKTVGTDFDSPGELNVPRRRLDWNSFDYPADDVSWNRPCDIFKRVMAAFSMHDVFSPFADFRGGAKVEGMQSSADRWGWTEAKSVGAFRESALAKLADAEGNFRHVGLAEMSAAWRDISRHRLVHLPTVLEKEGTCTFTYYNADGSVDSESTTDINDTAHIHMPAYGQTYSYTSAGVRYLREEWRTDDIRLFLHVRGAEYASHVDNVRAQVVYHISQGGEIYSVGLNNPVVCTRDPTYAGGEIGGIATAARWEFPAEYLTTAYLKNVARVWGHSSAGVTTDGGVYAYEIFPWCQLDYDCLDFGIFEA